jgi:protocatechuate 3,4-dioxygenase beta subunit
MNETIGAGGLSRRQLLGLLGAVGALRLLGCGGENESDADPLACEVKPEQTEGPYFVDELLNRSDIRSDPTDQTVKPGVPLRLLLNVSRVDGGSCSPLSGAFVDVWHCDALGVYSDVAGSATAGKQHLRGYQVTDANGRVEFLTIYPGWYSGRTVHIHFKIRLFSGSQTTYEFTSQLYFDPAVTTQVHTQAPYNARGQADTENDEDSIYAGGGAELLLQLTQDGDGYVGTVDVGLEMS